ncbi:MAG TPA: Ig-like domain-containing protein [Gemmataceae bacterium]|nr:Ig-like domain-containing protein [Gemmataceae bacterium]
MPASGKERGPALLGSYRIDGGLVRFEPRFPLVPGVRYQAILELARIPTRAALKEKPIEKEILLAKEKKALTEVTQVYPTADRLPENQLKFYLQFSAPMSRGDSYKHIKLLDENGKAVDLPFLELDQELWDGTGQRLTVFCDPGRIKRGLKPREEFGPVLEEGKRYTLVIDKGLEDGNGNPLKETFKKSFQATAPDDTQPDPKNWKIKAPRAGTRKPVIVTFPKPLDQALLERLVWVADAGEHKLAGKITLSEHETVWQFTPEKAWDAGTFLIVADTRLEDLAGNSIAKPFEVDEFRQVEREVKKETVKVHFKVE